MSEKIKKFTFTLKYALDIGDIELDFKTLKDAQTLGIIPFCIDDRMHLLRIKDGEFQKIELSHLIKSRNATLNIEEHEINEFEFMGIQKKLREKMEISFAFLKNETRTWSYHFADLAIITELNEVYHFFPIVKIINNKQ